MEGTCMKALAAIHTLLGAEGENLVIDEVEFGDPEEGQVRLRHFAGGIRHSQTHTMKNPRVDLPLRCRASPHIPAPTSKTPIGGLLGVRGADCRLFVARSRAARAR